jgi:hypothetical protein
MPGFRTGMGTGCRKTPTCVNGMEAGWRDRKLILSRLPGRLFEGPSDDTADPRLLVDHCPSGAASPITMKGAQL